MNLLLDRSLSKINPVTTTPSTPETPSLDGGSDYIITRLRHAVREHIIATSANVHEGAARACVLQTMVLALESPSVAQWLRTQKINPFAARVGLAFAETSRRIGEQLSISQMFSQDPAPSAVAADLKSDVLRYFQAAGAANDFAARFESDPHIVFDAQAEIRDARVWCTTTGYIQENDQPVQVTKLALSLFAAEQYTLQTRRSLVESVMAIAATRLAADTTANKQDIIVRSLYEYTQLRQATLGRAVSAFRAIAKSSPKNGIGLGEEAGEEFCQNHPIFTALARDAANRLESIIPAPSRRQVLHYNVEISPAEACIFRPAEQIEPQGKAPAVVEQICIKDRRSLTHALRYALNQPQ